MTETTYDLDLPLVVDEVIRIGEGTGSHKDLRDRDAADQHPISAITGLADALAVQADWNQTDTAKPDYIKNKPAIPGGVTRTTYTITGDGSSKEFSRTDVPDPVAVHVRDADGYREYTSERWVGTPGAKGTLTIGFDLAPPSGKVYTVTYLN